MPFKIYTLFKNKIESMPLLFECLCPPTRFCFPKLTGRCALDKLNGGVKQAYWIMQTEWGNANLFVNAVWRMMGTKTMGT